MLIGRGRGVPAPLRHTGHHRMTTPPPLPPTQPGEPAPVPFATPVPPPPPAYGAYPGPYAGPYPTPYDLPAPPPEWFVPPPAPAGERNRFAIHWAALIALVPCALVMFIGATEEAADRGM